MFYLFAAQEEEDIGYELFRDIVRNHLLNGGAKSASASSAPTMVSNVISCFSVLCLWYRNFCSNRRVRTHRTIPVPV
jgi:hypothetical protein